VTLLGQHIAVIPCMQSILPSNIIILGEVGEPTLRLSSVLCQSSVFCNVDALNSDIWTFRQYFAWLLMTT